MFGQSVHTRAGGVLVHDGARVSKYGLFHGFGSLEWLLVVLNGLGGLLVAATMKYADNIVKCFGTSLAVVTGTLLSIPIFGFQPSSSFSAGAVLTVFASALYSWGPDCSPLSSTTLENAREEADDEQAEKEPLKD